MAYSNQNSSTHAQQANQQSDRQKVPVENRPADKSDPQKHAEHDKGGSDKEAPVITPPPSRENTEKKAS